jgi:Gpi18-like mannosyltransferase
MAYPYSYSPLTKEQYLHRLLNRCAVPIIAFFAISSSLLVFLPFWLDNSIEMVFRHWDGPNYVYLAKSLYDVPINHPLSTYTVPSYFAAHLPVYPLTIKLFSALGYLNSMLFSTVLYAACAAIVFYKLLLETKVVRIPLWSAIISLFIPVRYLLNHSIGATEAPFLFFTLASMLAYVRGYYVWAFVLGGISGITRITGILIGGAYFLNLVAEKKWKYIPLLAIIPVPLLVTFTFYHFQYGDFFAYFGINYSDTNKLINLSPFQMFRNYSANGNSHSAEFYLIMYAIYGLGTALLWSINRLFFFFCAVTFCFSIFIFHGDVSRYLIPMAPFALVVAFDKVLSRKEAMVFFFPALCLAYTYVWGMVPKNVVDKKSFVKLKTVLETTQPEKVIISDFSQIKIRACSYGACESSILNRESKQSLSTHRGLNVFAYTHQHELELINVFDHCTSRDVYKKTKLISEKLLSKLPQIDKIILLSNDTVNCTQRPLNELRRWVGGYSLQKLYSLRLRETYIGVIDLESKNVVEYKSKSTISLP